MLTCAVIIGALLLVSIVLPVNIGILPDLWLLYGSHLSNWHTICTQMPDFHNTYSSSLDLTTHCIYPPLFLKNSFFFTTTWLLWCTPIIIINTFWNKYRFVSPSSKKSSKINLKHMHKGYYPTCQCWSIAPTTQNGITYRTLSVMHNAQICLSLSCRFYKSVLKMTKNTFGCTIFFTTWIYMYFLV